MSNGTFELKYAWHLPYYAYAAGIPTIMRGHEGVRYFPHFIKLGEIPAEFAPYEVSLPPDFEEF